MRRNSCAIIMILFLLCVTSITIYARQNAFFDVQSGKNKTVGEAYDYRSQTLDETAKEYADIVAAFDLIKDQAGALGVDSAALSSGRDWGICAAVEVYMLDAQDFIGLLERGEIARETIEYVGEHVWRIPLGKHANGNNVYSNVYRLENGKYDAVTIENKPERSNVAYVFDKQLVSEILANYNIEAATLIAISIRQIHSDFILISDAQGNNRFISFSTRPDFLGLGNGRIYTQEEVKSAVCALNESMNSATVFGGADSFAFRFICFVIVSVSVLGAVVLIAKRVLHKKQK